MQSITNNVAIRVAAAVVGFAMVVSALFGVAAPANAALTEAQIQSILSLLSSFGADQTTINNVNASLRGQPTTPTTPSTPAGVCPYVWSATLQQGSTGADVMKLQQFLNSMSDTQVSASGAGSAGN